MNEEIIHILSSKLKKDTDQIKVKKKLTCHFQITVSPKKIFQVTVKDPFRKYFLSIISVTQPEYWYFKDLKTSMEILDSLQLKYSSYPKIVDYFRTTIGNQTYDAVMMDKGKGLLLHELFHPNKLPTLKAALIAFGRGLAELHLKKVQTKKIPGQEFQKRMNQRLETCMKGIDKIDIPYSKQDCLNVINILYDQAFANPFVTGIIHYDPHPNNFMYDPNNGKLILLDTDKIPLSIDNKGRGIGPIALDYAKATKGIEKRLNILNLPKNFIDYFNKPYKEMMGNNFPNEYQITYYEFLMILGTAWFSSKINNPSDTQIKIGNYARKELTSMISRYI